jgi:hypothetical protein
LRVCSVRRTVDAATLRPQGNFRAPERGSVSWKSAPQTGGHVFDPAVTRVFTQALVVGVFGGAGLVLTQLYSRRGPLIYPVYAAILAALALCLARAGPIGFSARFAAAFGGLVVSTAIAMTGTMVIAARARRELLASGRPFAQEHIPLWAAPLLLTLLLTASAGAAYLSL